MNGRADFTVPLSVVKATAGAAGCVACGIRRGLVTHLKIEYSLEIEDPQAGENQEGRKAFPYEELIMD